jgi:hypothetical protein
LPSLLSDRWASELRRVEFSEDIENKDLHSVLDYLDLAVDLSKKK